MNQIIKRLLFFLVLVVPALLPAAGAQRLADFRRVVIADDALPVQENAAKELARYVGEISGQEIGIMTMSEHAKTKVAGLSFFVGEAAAFRELGEELAPWKLPSRYYSGLMMG